MTLIVVDANFSLAQVLPLPYSPNVIRCMEVWQVEMPHLLAPSLWEYEVVTGLRRSRVQGLLTQEEVQLALNLLLNMELEILPTSPRRHQLALDWAERLKQSRAYDAQYLALTEELGAEFWTGDRRLANSAQSLGVNWVHWAGET